MHIPKVIQFTENLFFFDVTARVAAKWSLAHAAGETAHMPAQVVDLKQRYDKLAKRQTASESEACWGSATKPQ